MHDSLDACISPGRYQRTNVDIVHYIYAMQALYDNQSPDAGSAHNVFTLQAFALPLRLTLWPLACCCCSIHVCEASYPRVPESDNNPVQVNLICKPHRLRDP
jgi:hypothetical protein